MDSSCERFATIGHLCDHPGRPIRRLGLLHSQGQARLRVDLKRVRWEGPEALAAGRHTLEFDFKYDRLGFGTLAFNNTSGLGRGGTGVLKIDGRVVSPQTMERTIPITAAHPHTCRRSPSPARGPAQQQGERIVVGSLGLSAWTRSGRTKFGDIGARDLGL
jgi:hypothetical protein